MKIIGEDQKINLDIEIYGKNFMKKMLIFGSIAILVIACSSIAGIYVATAYNKHLISKYNLENQNNGDIAGSKNNSSDTNEQQNLLDNMNQNIKENQEAQRQLKNPVYSQEVQKRVNDIYVSNDEEKIAYLTFDDGPSSKITPQILQILKEENIKATFFVLRK